MVVWLFIKRDGLLLIGVAKFIFLTDGAIRFGKFQLIITYERITAYYSLAYKH
jgi:hypothetical protein